jgi:hypothetical protein
LAGISFTPEQLAEEIKKHLPDFEMSYTQITTQGRQLPIAGQNL